MLHIGGIPMTILENLTSERVAANRNETAIRLMEKRAAHNYSPLPVVDRKSVV